MYRTGWGALNKRRAKVLTVAILGLLIVSCEKGSQPGESALTDAGQDKSVTADDIQWFEGSVDEAFAYAKAEGKPIYLYWGAEWCPPCHAIKATVFRSAEFIARSKLFVPVYLDGDTGNAQAVGEEFGVLGYPTMIVFDRNGVELTRIPGGIDIQAYANVLDLTLSDLAPVSELVDGIVSGGKALSADECRLLAYYAWNQNPDLIDKYEETALYRYVYDACPDDLSIERSLLYMSYLDVLMDESDNEVNDYALSGTQIEEATTIVNAILDDPDLVRANVLAVILNGARITRTLTEKDSDERQAMIGDFTAALNDLAEDESVFKRERVYTVLGKLFLEQIDDSDAELSPGLQKEIEAMVAWADASTPDPYERQAVINAAFNVLFRAGMIDVARPLILAEIERARQPYYFMNSMAEIEQGEGNYVEALQWLKQAYDASTGPATRFQWGYYYVAGLLEMTPEDAELIQAATVEVIRELDAGSGFYQRPKAQLERLERRLLDWGEETDHGDTISAIHDDVMLVCSKFSEQRDSFETCQAFLDSA
jgi:thiol-disulfide isomerase/thioredoxin